jgi:hypothetical protein
MPLNSSITLSLVRFDLARESAMRLYRTQWSLWLRQKLTIAMIIYSKSKGMLVPQSMHWVDKLPESLSAVNLRIWFLLRWPDEYASSDFKIWQRYNEVNYISSLSRAG